MKKTRPTNRWLALVNFNSFFKEDKMKTKLFLAVLMAVTMSAPALAQHGHADKKEDTKPIVMTGEVIDLTCFIQHPANALGMEHAKCAKTCMNQGLPIGFLAEDGTVYLLIGGGHDPLVSTVVDVVGKKVALSGIVIKQKGLNAIQFVSVAEVK